MTGWITSLIDSLGYGGVLFLMVLENVFPPIPSELIMPLAGFLAGQGRMSFPLAVLAGTAGSVLGALPLYALGRWVGQARLCRWTERHGHWLAVSPNDIRHAREWFDRHGGKAVLLGRLVPGVRSLVSIPAGTAEMAILPFLGYTAVGTALWAGLLTGLGMLLGQNYARVERFLGPLTYLVLGVFVVAFVIRVIRLKRAQRKTATSDTGATQSCAERAPSCGEGGSGPARATPNPEECGRF